MLNPEAEALLVAKFPAGRYREYLLARLRRVPNLDNQLELARYCIHLLERPHLKRKYPWRLRH
jgi:hypothetical protein